MSTELTTKASKPYDEYINRVVTSIVGLSTTGDLTPRNLREFLADTWMEGLKYSLVMIESEKRRRNAE